MQTEQHILSSMLPFAQHVWTNLKAKVSFTILGDNESLLNPKMVYNRITLIALEVPSMAALILMQIRSTKKEVIFFISLDCTKSSFFFF